MRRLISLSPAVAEVFSELTGKTGPDWFCAHDPVDSKLGSGGGTVHLLREAWRSEGEGDHFSDWLSREGGIILHAGGQSRRLPAYAAEGKALIPVPVARWSLGQRIDQTLLDLQMPFLEKVFSQADGESRWLIGSGDVLLEADALPDPLPTADVVCLGLWGEPEQASRHGVFFTPRSDPSRLSFMLQKPTLDAIRKGSEGHYFLLDVGVWLLSPRAMKVLAERSLEPGDDPGIREFDLYGTFGPAMGEEPHEQDADINALTTAIVPMEGGRFYHFGSGSDIIHSCLELQNRVIDQRRLSNLNIKPHPSLFVQNSALGKSILSSSLEDIWLENCSIPAGWQLSRGNIVTGMPENDWGLQLEPGMCLDVVPMKKGGRAWRVYGQTDPFRGAVGEETTLYCGEPLAGWLGKRGLSLEALGLDPTCDIQEAPIFPVMENLPDEAFVQWLLTGSDDSHAATFLSLPRVSADAISAGADLGQMHASRRYHLSKALPAMYKHSERSVFYQVDLEDLARKCHADKFEPSGSRPDPESDLFAHIRDAMFRSRLLELGGQSGQEESQRAFRSLSGAMIDTARENPVRPRLDCLDDQIIWGRSPVRLDLAGGWSDTPPYCFLNGGRVVNVAVQLNGQPPIQVFVRKRKKRGIRIRSIDLGHAEEIMSYDDLRSYAQLGSGFAVPKAALALCGFLPEFHAGSNPGDLPELLENFGSGFEMSLLCAVPKGSGLGTSSILAATVLGVLNDFCQLGWDQYAIAQRVLVLEQMLTSGGGWQDQYGGICRGLKYLETNAGLDQMPTIHWIDDHLLTDPVHESKVLLYYTGITRVAKNLLGEIVQGMFLNSRDRLGILDKISQHAAHTRDILNQGSFEGLAQAIDRSWRLNQALDAGTNPPEVQAILEPISDWIAGCKLLGAGGGGYLLMLAKDGPAAVKIKQHMEAHPTNDRARFVDVKVSREGMQVTRS
ncbi:MAG: bifunctional fucokinase/fucose-1-phosphate guanylyltransferase [Puniceicoccaceae bacterium]